MNGDRHKMAGKTTSSRRKTATTSQIVRKRELDRFAQRASRERTRLRLEFLEEKIQTLEAVDGPGQVAELMRKVEELRQENSRLRSLTWKIRCLADSVGPSKSSRFKSVPEKDQGEENTNPVSKPPNKRCRRESEPSAPPVRWQENWLLSPLVELQQPPFVPPSPQPRAAWDFTYDLDFPPASDDVDWSSMQSPLTVSRSTPRLAITDGFKPTTLDKLFAYAVAGVRESTGHPSALDSHVAFRSILWTGEGVEGDCLSHPLWKALRAIDKNVWGNWRSKAQRIAAMYLCYKLLMYLSNPRKDTLAEVPAFMRPLSCQKQIIHPIAADFHLWPGLREYQVRTYDPDYHDPVFPELLLSNMNFEWPFSDDAIFTSPENDQNDPPRLSGTFKEYASNINNWWMAEDFFAVYDELRPCFSPGYRFEGTAPKRTQFCVD